ncbi:protein POF1B isoform X2 [Brachyhypopomus gauderio]|uniref:protein POF1B isoform X2 n=1 Tax=Brachyhypopomus gauderio TaxID=698409 RepID=UPI0040424218
MSVPTAYSTSTLRTVSVSSEPSMTTVVSPTQFGINGGATLRRVNAVNVAGAPLSPVQYVNGTVNGTVLQGNVRYLVPVQHAAESYVLVNQAPQVVSPLYLHNLKHVSVTSTEEVDSSLQHNSSDKTSSVFFQTPSPAKSPDPIEHDSVHSSGSNVHEVHETIHVDVTNRLKTESPQSEPQAQLDTRFFGELLAEVYRKNCDILGYISEHVSKIRGRKHLLDPTIDYKVEKDDVETLIPKGLSELTKQQIRYLLQTRMTADKTMLLLLTTFSSLREELVHLQDDLRRLESEKDQLERDLSFKADQAQQYDRLLEAVRENNRQLQSSLKESSMAHRTMESKLLSSQSTDSSKDFRIKELEGSMLALEQERDLLRRKLQGQCSTSTLNTKIDELTRHYEQMLSSLREEKDKEVQNMRSQIIKVQTERHTERHTETSSDRSLELKITELLSKLEQRESVIKRQEEEIRRLQQNRSDVSKNVTKTVITNRYTNQYPILGLLSDDYQSTSPIKESKTIVIQRTGTMTKQE